MYHTHILEIDRLPAGTVTVDPQGGYSIALITGAQEKLVLKLPIPVMQQLIAQTAECTDILHYKTMNDGTKDHLHAATKGAACDHY